MKNWKSGFLLIAIMICIAIYIGIYIGRTNSRNNLFLPSLIQTDSEQTDHAILTLELNTATADELVNNLGIDKSTAKAIIQYREEYGDFISTIELMRVDGMNYEIYKQIESYLTVGGSQ